MKQFVVLGLIKDLVLPDVRLRVVLLQRMPCFQGSLLLDRAEDGIILVVGGKGCGPVTGAEMV